MKVLVFIGLMLLAAAIGPTSCALDFSHAAYPGDGDVVWRGGGWLVAFFVYVAVIAIVGLLANRES